MASTMWWIITVLKAIVLLLLFLSFRTNNNEVLRAMGPVLGGLLVALCTIEDVDELGFWEDLFGLFVVSGVLLVACWVEWPNNNGPKDPPRQQQQQQQRPISGNRQEHEIRHGDRPTMSPFRRTPAVTDLDRRRLLARWRGNLREGQRDDRAAAIKWMAIANTTIIVIRCCRADDPEFWTHLGQYAAGLAQYAAVLALLLLMCWDDPFRSPPWRPNDVEENESQNHSDRRIVNPPKPSAGKDDPVASETDDWVLVPRNAATAGASSFSLTVHLSSWTARGRRFTVGVPSPEFTTLGRLKAAIEDASLASCGEHLAMARQKLVYHGKVLKDDSRSLREYGIVEAGSILFLVMVAATTPNSGIQTAATESERPGDGSESGGEAPSKPERQGSRTVTAATGDDRTNDSAFRCLARQQNDILERHEAKLQQLNAQQTRLDQLILHQAEHLQELADKRRTTRWKTNANTNINENNSGSSNKETPQQHPFDSGRYATDPRRIPSFAGFRVRLQKLAPAHCLHNLRLVEGCTSEEDLTDLIRILTLFPEKLPSDHRQKVLASAAKRLRTIRRGSSSTASSSRAPSATGARPKRDEAARRPNPCTTNNTTDSPTPPK